MQSLSLGYKTSLFTRINPFSYRTQTLSLQGKTFPFRMQSLFPQDAKPLSRCKTFPCIKSKLLHTRCKTSPYEENFSLQDAKFLHTRSNPSNIYERKRLVRFQKASVFMNGVLLLCLIFCERKEVRFDHVCTIKRHNYIAGQVRESKKPKLAVCPIKKIITDIMHNYV